MSASTKAAAVPEGYPTETEIDCDAKINMGKYGANRDNEAILMRKILHLVHPSKGVGSLSVVRSTSPCSNAWFKSRKSPTVGSTNLFVSGEYRPLWMASSNVRPVLDVTIDLLLKAWGKVNSSPISGTR